MRSWTAALTLFITTACVEGPPAAPSSTVDDILELAPNTLSLIHI